MTICISAICKHNNKEAIVFATDHMIDVGIGLFEHGIMKYKKINEKTIAMLAGRALLFNDLINGLPKNLSFNQIKLKIYENFGKLRVDWIRRELLCKYGLNYEDIGKVIKGQIPNPFITKLFEQITKFSFETTILLIGFEDGTAKISEVQDIGFADFSDIYFHAIGSGNIQAINTLMFQKQSKHDNLLTTIYNVYKAKRNAEVRVGVGRDTDLLVLTERKCIKLNEGDIKQLSEVYETELNMGKTSKDLYKLKVINYL